MVRKDSRQNGATLAELTVSTAIMALILTCSVAALDSIYRRAVLRSAAGRVRELLQHTQLDAHMLGANRAVKFIQRPEGWNYAVYEDGNGDGVSNSEIATGVDHIVVSERPLADENGVYVGLLAGETDPDGGPPLSSPVNFNHSTLCSFSPRGSATPGTVYLTDGSGAVAVRSSGDDGMVRILVYTPASGQWVEL